MPIFDNDPYTERIFFIRLSLNDNNIITTRVHIYNFHIISKINSYFETAKYFDVPILIILICFHD